MRTQQSTLVAPAASAAAGAVLAVWILVHLAGPPPAAAQQAAPAGALDLPEVVARVDGHAITKGELLAHAQMMRVQAVQAGRADPATSEGFLRVVLEALIGERLVYADGQSRGSAPATLRSKSSWRR